MSPVRRLVGSAGLLLCFGAGLAAAVAAAGCGGDGNVAEQISTARSPGLSGTRPAATQTSEAAIVAPTSPPSDTEVQSVATVTETRPAATVTRSATLEVTVTASAQPAPQTTAAAPATTAAAPATTAAAASANAGTDIWVWTLVAVGGVLLVGLLVWLLRRGSSGQELGRRERTLAAAVASWTAQGWAIESHTGTTTVLRRDGERVSLTVEPDASITSLELAPSADAAGSRESRAPAPPPVDR